MTEFPVGARVEIVASEWSDGLDVGREGEVIEVDGDPLRRDSRWMESRRVRLFSNMPPRWFAKDALRSLDIVEKLAELGRPSV